MKLIITAAIAAVLMAIGIIVFCLGKKVRAVVSLGSFIFSAGIVILALNLVNFMGDVL